MLLPFFQKQAPRKKTTATKLVVRLAIASMHVLLSQLLPDALRTKSFSTRLFFFLNCSCLQRQQAGYNSQQEAGRSGYNRTSSGRCDAMRGLCTTR
jgi:hypothetical protein